MTSRRSKAFEQNLPLNANKTTVLQARESHYYLPVKAPYETEAFSITPKKTVFSSNSLAIFKKPTKQRKD